MARDRQEIEAVANAVLTDYVCDVRIFTDAHNHPVMALSFDHGHKMTILETDRIERLLASKFPHQKYCIEILDPDGNQISERFYMTAKMVKMAILKTKKLDLLKNVKGVKHGRNRKRSRRERRL